jgi:hypothetical protein
LGEKGKIQENLGDFRKVLDKLDKFQRIHVNFGVQVNMGEYQQI